MPPGTEQHYDPTGNIARLSFLARDTRPMTRTELLEASQQYIREILLQHLQGHPRVYLFGSRARQDARWNSDFDLWIDADIPAATLSKVAEAIDESFVPFKVDIVTTPKLQGQFGAIVREEAVPWM